MGYVARPETEQTAQLQAQIPLNKVANTAFPVPVSAARDIPRLDELKQTYELIALKNPLTLVNVINVRR